MSQSLHGKISDRLRKELSPKDPAWNPRRPAESGQGKGKIPDGVSGTEMTGRKR